MRETEARQAMREVELKQRKQRAEAKRARKSERRVGIYLLVGYVMDWVVVSMITDWAVGFDLCSSKLYFVIMFLMMSGWTEVWIKILQSRYERLFRRTYGILIVAIAIAAVMLSFAIRAFGFEKLILLVGLYMLLAATFLGANMARLLLHIRNFA